MKIKIKDLEGFKNNVFGADSFLKYWPQLTTEGLQVELINDYFYLIENGKLINDTAFFSRNEMEYLEQVVDQKPIKKI
jgi:hypothetical protein